MEDLILLAKKRIIARENINYIQTLRKHQRNNEKWLKIFEDGDMVLWLPKDPKIKKRNFFFFRLVHFE
jgi:ABC-type molybdate transport system substrate-binding protein